MPMKWFLALAVCLAAMPAGADSSLTASVIDRQIRAQWAADNTVPAPPVDDARFMRRVYLDVVGKIPTASEVTAFLADNAPDKRVRLVERLLSSPDYAENWTNYWDNVLMGRSARSQVLDRVAWREWLHKQFEQNVPWNKMVYDLLTATGQNSTGGGYSKIAGLMNAPAMMRPNSPSIGGRGAQAQDHPEDAAKVNGAVNWYLKYAQAPADLSGNASKIFLGVQIQCAQCHDHKTEKWKQEDFRRFTACFVAVRPFPLDRGMVKGLRRVDVEDVNRPVMRFGKNAQGFAEYLSVPPATLDGKEIDTANRRKALADWMTARDNPWFAEAIVNRMWAHFLGRGFVNPVDDLRPSNPPAKPELFKQMADDFASHGYDLKRLINQITSTEVYQLSAAPGKNVDPENKYWARFRLKPLGPEELVGALVQATNMQPVLEKVAGANLEALKFAINRQFTFLFDTDEESEQKDFEGTIPQALMLLNGNLVNRGASPIPGTALAEVLAMPGGDAAKIEALYLRTLSRKPTPAEVAKWSEFLHAPRDAVVTDTVAEQPQARAQLRMGRKAIRQGNGPDPLARVANRFAGGTPTAEEQAYEDMFWTLLNCSEFAFNH